MKKKFQLSAIEAIDFYKFAHYFCYPKDVTGLYANFTPRTFKHLNYYNSRFFDKKVVFFGLQMFVQRFLIDAFNETFFNRPVDEVIGEFKKRVDTALFGDFNLNHFRELHALGYLPIMIKALPEGTRVRENIPVFTVQETDSRFAWVALYLESVISAEVWKKMVNATTAYHFRQIFKYYAEITGTPVDFIDWQGHDFSMRGMSGWEDAAYTGVAHLTCFKGTDTVPAISVAEHFYGIEEGDMIGGSVPATEHSVMCALIQQNKNRHPEWDLVKCEEESFRYLLTEVYPTGIVSIVSDTYNFWDTIDKVAGNLKDVILNREGKVVFRPDSGDPVDIICGKYIPDLTVPCKNNFEIAKTSCAEDLRDDIFEDTPHGEPGDDEAIGYFIFDGKYYELKVEIEWNRYDKQYYYIDGHHIEYCREITPTPEILGAVRVLDRQFGHTVNENGYKVLNKVGVIYGDSITPQRLETILSKLEKMGYESGNFVAGIGSFTYNYNTRDSIGAAMKATSMTDSSGQISLYKDPITDSGMKKSAVGLLQVIEEDGELVLKQDVTEDEEMMGVLQPVFIDGKAYNTQSLSDIRRRLR